MALEGIGLFTWKIPRCENGDPAAIAAVARRAQITHVMVKIADGTTVYNGDWGSTVDMVTPLVQVLRAEGVQVLGWQYVYGDNPLGEARIAIQRLKQLNLDGFVIDAEGQYETSTKKAAASTYMKELRTSLPTLPVALSSYRYPSLHTQLPWQEFLNRCDFVMPQVYWMKSHDPGVQLAKCVREFQTRTPFRPVIPTGAAFAEHGWQPTAGEVLEFLNTAKALNLSAVNFWEWADARSGIMPGVWETICDFSWTGIPAPQDICQRFVAALNQRDPVQMLNFYSPTAVQVTAARTVQGPEAIGTWYTTLFSQVLPNATFTLTGFSGTGNSRHFTWTANSSKGVVQNGNDTLGLIEDRIAYHYTFFTVTPAG